ncbi:MAG: MOSC domain-containing protein [Steroidobacteraceae bacterium]
MTSIPAANPPVLTSVQAGPIAPLGPNAVPSAFVKRAVTGPVRVARLGLEVDAQADRRVHGGLEKAVYAYPTAHYPAWAADFPELASRFVHGGFGENLSIDGLTEADLCVGDVHAIGTVRLQVCQPRQPCFKLALNFQNSRLPKAMVRNGRSGWYYRVLAPGTLQAGDAIQLVERPLPDFPFTALLDFLYSSDLQDHALERIAHTALVAGSLRSSARKALNERRF